jgi:hypothetical protein
MSPGRDVARAGNFRDVGAMMRRHQPAPYVRLEQIAIDLNHFVFQINRVNLLYYNMLDRIHALGLDQVLIQPKSDPI